MTKYFKNVESLEDLKNQFKVLAQKNRPDAGGNAGTVKEINCEYDALFPIWRNRHNIKEPRSQTTETTDNTRHKFYTEWDWEGSRYDSNMSTAEISRTIEIYCREKYPAWRSSVTSEYSAGGSSINIFVMEAPEQIFDLEPCHKAYAEHLEAGKVGYYGGCGLAMDIEKVLADGNMHWQLHSISDRDEQYFTEYGFTAVEDVYKFMQSYNFDDSDSMIDYFRCDFYESFNIGKWNKGFKVAPRTARIKNQGITPAKKANKKAAEPRERTSKGVKNSVEYTYKVTKGEGTRDGPKLWPVRIEETLDRKAYEVEAAAMKERSGYYSKFRRTFILRFDLTGILSGGKAA